MEMIFWLLAGIIMTHCIMTFGETTFAAHHGEYTYDRPGALSNRLRPYRIELYFNIALG